MGSDLFDVRVDDLGTTHVDLHVQRVHPDAETVSTDATFAFQLLCDPILQLDEDDRVKQAPLFEEVDVTDYLSDRFVRANARGFVVGASFARVNADSTDALLRVQVSHSGWLEHLRVGMRWGTGACSSGDGDPWQGRLRAPGDTRREVSDDPLEGMRLLSSRGRPIDAYEEDCFVVPRYGAKHYATKTAIVGQDITLDAVASLFRGAVRVVGSTGGFAGPHVGTFLRGDPDGMTLFQLLEDGDSGTIGFPFSELKSVGQAWYIRKLRARESDE